MKFTTTRMSSRAIFRSCFIPKLFASTITVQPAICVFSSSDIMECNIKIAQNKSGNFILSGFQKPGLVMPTRLPNLSRWARMVMKFSLYIECMISKSKDWYFNSQNVAYFEKKLLLETSCYNVFVPWFVRPT